ncbi:MAG TPA: hypothetical protein PK826_12520 [Anaerolineae bacterium]|nr:hypothetical protein [Anaerolineae bacterium]
MAFKIDPPLRAHLKRAAAAAPDIRLSFIVTLRTMDASGALTRRGFHIALYLDPVLAVSGTATPSVALALARLPQVRRIELDGEMVALN